MSQGRIPRVAGNCGRVRSRLASRSFRQKCEGSRGKPLRGVKNNPGGNDADLGDAGVHGQGR